MREAEVAVTDAVVEAEPAVGLELGVPDMLGLRVPDALGLVVGE